MSAEQGKSTYHHGDLRRALLAASVDIITDEGLPAMSLREVARRCGVSHTAAAHHFSGRRGLLTAVATEGYIQLAKAMASAQQRGFLEVGVAYVSFAVEHPAMFEVMFRPDLHDPTDEVLLSAKHEASRHMVPSSVRSRRSVPLRSDAIAAWSIVHGLATLLITGNVSHDLAGDPAQLARDVLKRLQPPKGRIRSR
jgi:AcrR family transcriptional regulator